MFVPRRVEGDVCKQIYTSAERYTQLVKEPPGTSHSLSIIILIPCFRGTYGDMTRAEPRPREANQSHEGYVGYEDCLIAVWYIPGFPGATIPSKP